MKGTQKITRVKLTVEQNNDYIILGLVSAEPDYKISLSLNKKFGISLKNISPLRLPGADESQLIFSRFANIDDRAGLNLILISNRSGKDYLLKKLKNIDYLLQIQSAENDPNISKITTGLREIDAVTAVFNIDINTIKDKNLQYLTQ
jgi:hypothetical protein